MKKERFEATRARLVFDVIINENAYYLRIKNIGKENAFNVVINVNSDFINAVNNRDKIIFKELSKPFFVLADRPNHYFMGYCEAINKEWKERNVGMKL